MATVVFKKHNFELLIKMFNHIFSSNVFKIINKNIICLNKFLGKRAYRQVLKRTVER